MSISSRERRKIQDEWHKDTGFAIICLFLALVFVVIASDQVQKHNFQSKVEQLKGSR
jgi:hypothetical protein